MKIGLAISGGGYRATAYSLGMMNYLDNIQYPTDKRADNSLLQQVEAMSTVSGGSITGMTYALAQKENKSFSLFYKDLTNFMLKNDLIGGAVKNLVKPGNPNSMIESIGDLYHNHLFGEKKYSALRPNMDQEHEHVKFLCVNATDFNHGIPFRFVFQPSFMNMKIGNALVSLTNEAADKVPLYVPLAASSCFPGGFEPIQIHRLNGAVVNDPTQSDDPAYQKEIISLMDGGIVDNQGIEAILLYDKSINEPTSAKVDAKVPKQNLDMFIVTDVSTSDIEPYKAQKKVNIPLIGDVKMIILFRLILVVNLFTIIGYLFPFVHERGWLLTLNNIFTTLLTFTSIGLLIGKKVVSQLAGDTVGVGKIKQMNLLTPNSTIELLGNRGKSLGMLVGSVFMKNLRNKNYSDMYGKSENRMRAINSSIDFFLKEQQKLYKNEGVYSATTVSDERLYAPILDKQKHDPIFKIAFNASNMDTTLWMPNKIKNYQVYKEILESHKEKKIDKVTISPEGLLRDVIVCGQMTTCYNLLKKSITVLNAKRTKKEISAIRRSYAVIYQQTLTHWQKFEENPYWMYELNGAKGIKMELTDIETLLPHYQRSREVEFA